MVIYLLGQQKLMLATVLLTNYGFQQKNVNDFTKLIIRNVFKKKKYTATLFDKYRIVFKEIEARLLVFKYAEQNPVLSQPKILEETPNFFALKTFFIYFLSDFHHYPSGGPCCITVSFILAFIQSSPELGRRLSLVADIAISCSVVVVV